MAYTKEKVEAGIAENEKEESLKRWAQEGRRISELAQLRATAADLEQQNAALKANNATLLGRVTAENEQNAALVEALRHLMDIATNGGTWTLEAQDRMARLVARTESAEAGNNG